MDLTIRIRARHHGLFTETVIDGEQVEFRRVTFVVVFPLAPKMLPPIAPPRRRGRPLPPEDAGRIVVHLAGPM